MFLFKSLLLCILSLTFNTVRTQDNEIFSSLLDGGIIPIENLKADYYFVENKIKALVPEKVDIHLYYECLCGDCRNFDTMSLRTTDKGHGEYEFKCQHGPDECYGNKLHACAIDYLRNMTKAVFFNSCMMDSSRNNRGSNDEAADECGRTESVNPEWIKQCAKGPRGNALLKFYGDESKKVGFKFVPYILINGVLNDGNNFMKDVCAAFKTPPRECARVV